MEAVIIQPSLVYWKKTPEEADERMEKILIFAKQNNLIDGFEFDMGFITGRKSSDGKYTLTAKKKRENFEKYIEHSGYYFKEGYNIGIYSGGPNEQG